MDRLLVIDDDANLCELLAEYLAAEGFAMDAAPDGETGLMMANAGDYDLVVLDVMLPKKNGLEVLRHLRASLATPVVMLTARGDEVDRILGLELGADDYLSKPFNPRELVARIRAVLRRTGKERAIAPPAGLAPRLKVGDVELETRARLVSQAGRPIELTGVEFSLLAVLLRRAGEIVSREELIQEVLGRALSPFDRSIDVHVSKLRKKLGHEMNGLERIKTVRGLGYLYVLPPGEASPAKA